MFDSLDELLQRKSQRFICRNGWPEPSPSEHIVAIQHDAGPPTSPEQLRELEKQVGAMPELLAFYSRFGSLRLFSQIDADKSAYYIAAPSQWSELKGAFLGWIEDLNKEEKAELLPDWIPAFVVVGEIPNSGNYFLVPLTGDQRGRVFEFEHDGFEFTERGINFAAFVERLAEVNEELIAEISGHTRYRDSRPGSQWLIEEYLYDD